MYHISQNYVLFVYHMHAFANDGSLAVEYKFKKICLTFIRVYAIIIAVQYVCKWLQMQLNAVCKGGCECVCVCHWSDGLGTHWLPSRTKKSLCSLLDQAYAIQPSQLHFCKINTKINLTSSKKFGKGESGLAASQTKIVQIVERLPNLHGCFHPGPSLMIIIEDQPKYTHRICWPKSHETLLQLYCTLFIYNSHIPMYKHSNNCGLIQFNLHVHFCMCVCFLKLCCFSVCGSRILI